MTLEAHFSITLVVLRDSAESHRTIRQIAKDLPDTFYEKFRAIKDTYKKWAGYFY